MTYAEYQAYMAKYGFVRCPLTEAEFNEAKASGADDDDLYFIGCDVNAGVAFKRALEVNIASRT